MVQEHPIASVADRLLTVLAPARIDAHAGQGVSAPIERLLKGGVVAEEPRVDGRQILVRAEGNLEGVERAVERQLVPGLGVAGAVERSRVVERRVGEVEACQKLLGRRMDGVKVGRFAGRAVPDGKLQLNAYPPRARTAQRREEAPVDGRGKVLDCVWWLEHFAINYIP